MIDVEAEINKYKTCKDRDELERRIKEYKNLTLQYAKDIGLAGKYNKAALKLQEICNRLPAPNLKHVTGSKQKTPVKTATISHEENAQISAAWKEKAGNTRKG